MLMKGLDAQVVGCNGALMGALPWLFGAFIADFPVISWSWLQLPLPVFAIILHLIVAILQVNASNHCSMRDARPVPVHVTWILSIFVAKSAFQCIAGMLHVRLSCVALPHSDCRVH